MPAQNTTTIYYEILDYSDEIVWFHPLAGWCEAYSISQIQAEAQLDFNSVVLVQVQNEQWAVLCDDGSLGDLALAGEI